MSYQPYDHGAPLYDRLMTYVHPDDDTEDRGTIRLLMTEAAARRRHPGRVVRRMDGCRMSTTMVGDELRCLNCGDSYRMNMPAPLDVVTAAMRAFDKNHKACKPSSRGAARMTATTPLAWLQSWDTGESSKTIWYTMMGELCLRPSVPYDSDDFGRCHRLLMRFPEWRARLEEMRKVPGWEPLVDAWPELERLFEEESINGSCPRLYAAMQKALRR